MSDYTKTTDFLAKDSLAVGNANKIIKGAEFEVEFDAIAVAVNSKTELTTVIGAEHSWTAQQVPMGGSATATTTADWNCDTTGQVYDLAVGTSDFTMNAPTNVNNRACYILRITQHATTARIITWDAAYKFPGGVDAVLTPSLGAVDVFTFIGGAGNVMYCVGMAKALA